jgi:PAS domain S-box-containing protein
MSEQRVLLLASGPDADLGRAVLERMGVEHVECASLGAIADELAERGAAAVLLTDEVAALPDLDRFAETLREQPTWSDLPIVLLVNGAESPIAIRLSSLLGNVSVLDRSAGATALRNALRTALRARQRQYSLRDQNALNAAIVESSDDAIVTKSLDGTIRSWNGGAERLFGYTASEAIGRPITLIIPAHKQDEEVQILERLRRGERIDHFETTRVAKDGRELHISLTVSPLMDDHGHVFGASKVARDITSRKRAEAELRRQAAQLRLLWESAAALFTTNRPESMLPGVFYKLAPHLSLDAYLNFVVREQGSGFLESWAGISDAEAADIRRLGIVRLDSDVRDERQATSASRVQQSDGDGCLAKRLGFRSFISNPLIVDGTLIGTLAFASRSKDEFSMGELELMRTVCYYVTAAYARVSLIRRLRDTDRRKDEFLATLAHELRNPLAPIRNALEIMRVDGHERSAVEDVAHKMIERQVSQMTRLVDDLLDVSRITTGRLELRKERIELATVIRSAIETSRPLIDAAHHELSVELPSGPTLLDADPVRLAQVFSNVLNNAARYMAEGGRIRVAAERDDQMVTVIVQDFGIGIAPDALPRVFDMFAQGDAPGEHSHGGLGVGLTLVKRLVEMHSGSVEAYSEGRGRGTSISVRLPIAPAAAAPLRPTKADGGRRPSSTTHRILIADDNRDAAESMGMLLRLMGNDVRTVFDGVEAVEEAETFRPDLILLDIGMPKLNGYDAARRIREQEWSQSTKLIALTGWGREDDKRKAAEAGFDRHYTKPIDPAALERLIADFQSG